MRWLRTLTPWERRQAAAVLEAFAPPGGPGLAPPAGADLPFAETLERAVRAACGRGALGFRLALLTAALYPTVVRRWPSTMAGLARGERTRYLADLARHPNPTVRDFVMLLKIAASFALLADPALRAASGYDEGVAEARAALAATLGEGSGERRIDEGLLGEERPAPADDPARRAS